MSIEAVGISKLYDDQKALNEVSLSIKSGEIVGFLGPNGAGKSTFMKILTGFLEPSSGDAKVCGFDIKDDSIEIRKRVGYLPEHNPLYLDMYVKEYLDFIGGLYGIKNRKARIAEVIDLVGLQKEQHKKLGALSKGFRQRAGLAHAIIHDPEVLILDEPTTGLDPNQLDEIRGLIFNLGKEKTVMLSTHIMQEVEAICNRIIIINNGTIVANEAAGTMMKRQEKKVVSIEFANPFLADFKTLSGIDAVEKISDSHFLIGFSGDKDPREALFHFAVENNNPLIGLSMERRNLEEVFKELTSK